MEIINKWEYNGGVFMTEKQPSWLWIDNILWVWSEYYGRYVANYSPSHYLELGNEVDLELQLKKGTGSGDLE